MDMIGTAGLEAAKSPQVLLNSPCSIAEDNWRARRVGAAPRANPIPWLSDTNSAPVPGRGPGRLHRIASALSGRRSLPGGGRRGDRELPLRASTAGALPADRRSPAFPAP